MKSFRGLVLQSLRKKNIYSHGNDMYKIPHWRFSLLWRTHVLRTYLKYPHSPFLIISFNTHTRTHLFYVRFFWIYMRGFLLWKWYTYVNITSTCNSKIKFHRVAYVKSKLCSTTTKHGIIRCFQPFYKLAFSKWLIYYLKYLILVLSKRLFIILFSYIILLSCILIVNNTYI